LPEPAAEGVETETRAGLTLSPFFLVQRTLALGLDWRVETVVRRLTPTGAPASLDLPLLPGENPVSGVFSEKGRAVVNFGPQEDQVAWQSSLETAPTLTLTAEDGPWSESWALDASPIWRVETAGLIPIHHTRDGFWQPQWRPWPGESLNLKINRPEPAPGLYLVADRGEMTTTIGETRELTDLNFKVRASQGGPFTFSLPQGVEVREFTVNGRSVPLGQTSRDPETRTALTAPLTAGAHDINVTFSRETPLGPFSQTPKMDLGLPTANVTTTLILPQNRWILWAWGPMEGPAVLFWSVLAVTLLAALGLGRLKTTPLGWASWFLLSWGLIQLHLIAALIVAGWLLILVLRLGRPPSRFFNLAQVGLAFWTALALYLLYKGIENGLLKNPDMMIAGGSSYGQSLTWFTDRLEGAWPQGRAWSVSVWYYKALMLAWSLWLAAGLVGWLRWAWTAFSSGGFWRPAPPKAPRPAKEGQEKKD
jgi:hypothetical protein